MLVIMAGLPGTGKSTVAQALAHTLPGALLDKDIIRAALFAPAHVEYSIEQDDFCQEIMLQTAAYLLAKNPSLCVILDGRTFSRRYQRQRVFEFCAQMKTQWAILECVCAEETALRRLQEAAGQQIHPAMNRTPDLYHEIRKIWESIESPKLIIDTEADPTLCAERAAQYLAKISNESNPAPDEGRRVKSPEKRTGSPASGNSSE